MMLSPKTKRAVDCFRLGILRRLQQGADDSFSSPVLVDKARSGLSLSLDEAPNAEYDLPDSFSQVPVNVQQTGHLPYWVPIVNFLTHRNLRETFLTAGTLNSPSTVMLFVLICWFVFGLCAALVAANRGANSTLWFVLGFLLGPIGLVLAFFQGTRCPMCRKSVSTEARKCPYCQSEIADGQPVTKDDPATLVLVRRLEAEAIRKTN